MNRALDVVRHLPVREVRAVFAYCTSCDSTTKLAQRPPGLAQRPPGLDVVLAEHGITLGEFMTAYVLHQVLQKASSRSQHNK